MSDSNKQSLSDRMREYESTSDFRLMRRVPVVLRCDGRAFSKVTKGLEKPSYPFIGVMGKTLLEVAKDIEGCVFGFAQSDELTFVLRNDQSFFSQPWFDNRIQKMVSICASDTTYNFNKFLNESDLKLRGKTTFDCRAFTVPNVTEVVNNLIYRQGDCIRNAISTATDFQLGKKLGSGSAKKETFGKTGKQKIEMMRELCGIDFWTFYKPAFIRGMAVYKKDIEKLDPKGNPFVRPTWILDEDIPEFKTDSKIIVDAYCGKDV